MAIIDLNVRLTHDWSVFNKYKSSSDSNIYINDIGVPETISPASLDLVVGDKCWDPKNNDERFIAKSGLLIKPQESVVVYTKQKFGIPYNVFGVVTGKGNMIFQGGYVSAGKINPGFNGFLKIGYYNGSKAPILLYRDSVFASVYFISMESEINYPLENYQQGPEPKRFRLDKKRELFLWFKANWSKSLPIILSIIAIIVSILKTDLK